MGAAVTPSCLLKSLIAAPCRGNVLGKEREPRSMSGWQECSGVPHASAAPHCPVHASPWGAPGLGGAGGRETAAHPCTGQEAFPGAKSPAGKGSRVDRQRQLFPSFCIVLSWSSKCWRSHGDHTS